MDEPISMNERGNIWLVDEASDRQGFWGYLGESKWLEVTVCPFNYPGFNVQEIESSEEELALHITEHWQGAFAKKCNLDGVELDEQSYVLGEHY